jgi:hypothetical protein
VAQSAVELDIDAVRRVVDVALLPPSMCGDPVLTATARKTVSALQVAQVSTLERRERPGRHIVQYLGEEPVAG